MKKYILTFIFTLILGTALVSCGKEKGNQKIKVGINPTLSKQWEYVKQEAKKENIDLEIVIFTDYVQPNKALADKEIDINSFQTVSFLKAFNQKNNQTLTPIATTVLAPMGIYSKKIKSLTDLPEKAKISIPNDPSNQGRALRLLEKAGFIKLKDSNNQLSTNADIIENPKQLEIIPMAANQLSQTLNDVSVSVINNNFALDAGYFLKDALFKEDQLATDYVNVIAAREDNKNDPKLAILVKLFQSEEVKKIFEEETKGNSIPTFIPVSEIKF